MKKLLLPRHEIDQRLSSLNGWNLNDNQTSIFKTWEFDSFKTAMRFFVEVGQIAERHDHHPDFFSSYRTVKIELSTHDASGLTEKDFDLAAEIDHVFKLGFSEQATPK